VATIFVTLVAGVLIRFIDHSDFPSVGLGLWWALQTVTTVGYGDVVPKTVAGRVTGGVLMVTGIGFLTVVTATITAALVENVRRSLGDPRQERLESKLDDIDARLERLESMLRAQPPQ
jgi:voltage-gated potassium channel